MNEIATIIESLSGKARWELHVYLLCAWQTLPISKRPPNYTEWLLTRTREELLAAIEVGKSKS